MRISSWKFMLPLIALAMSAFVPNCVNAADPWPTKPVRLIVPFPAGGQGDVLARILAQRMVDFLDVPVVVDNVAGAGGTIAATAVARAKNDGYTLLFGTNGTQAVNPYLMKSIKYDPAKDFESIVPVATYSGIIIANPSFEASTISELIALAKKNPGRIQYAIPGVGTAGHLAMALLESSAGIKLELVAYRGGAPLSVDMIGGQIKLGAEGLPGQIENVRSGKLKALAITGAVRDPSAPQIPTIGETIPGFEALSWYAVFAPAGTPAAVVARLNDAANKALESPALRAQYQKIAANPTGGTSRQLQEFVLSEMKKWEKVVKDAAIEPQ